MPVVVAFSIFHVILFILVSCYRKDKACLRYIMFEGVSKPSYSKKITKP